MKIESIKKLDQLISLCRKRGINNIEIDGIKLELGIEPLSRYKKKKKLHHQEVLEESPSREMSFEEILFLSSTPPQHFGAVNE